MTVPLPPASFTFAPCDLALVDALRAELRCTETFAWVLARRGVSVEQARALLSDDPAADEAQLHDPMLLGDMAAAVERIRFAIEHDEQIVVHGDYDADGVCATTVLVEALESLGAEHVSAFLPDRFSNGYGLQLDQIERFARDGMRLLIAVDCGITAVEPIAQARDLGMDVIVCDHHQPGEQLPDAILCSTRPSDYPFPDICATVVAGKLASALGAPSTPARQELEAIATVADCMPLVGENRAIVRCGLRALRSTTRPGLRALAEQCGVRTPDIDADAIAFKLAPRINAVGRISQSERAYELLRAESSDAPRLAAAIDETNQERRRIEKTICDEAVAQVESWTEQQRAARIYVVHGRGWNEGVVGIVASRLVERYWRPVVVIADGDPARGSGRSIDGVDLHAALAACDDLLLRWGGHSQAGGVTVDPSRIDELRNRLAEWGDEHVDPATMAPHDAIDAIVHRRDIGFELVHEFERLAPFGTGWPRPRLLGVDATIEQASAVGGDGTHLRCTVVIDEVRTAGIGFGLAPMLSEITGRSVDVAMRPSINRFRGVESVQVQIDRIYPHAKDDEACVDAAWCAAACTHEHPDRIAARALLDRARELVGPIDEGSDPDRPPALEPLLSRAGTVDLRNRGLGAAHVAQLLAANASVLVVVADVPRRRALLEPLGIRDRFGAVEMVVAGDRVKRGALGTALARAATASRSFVVCDHATLDVVHASANRFDVVVVVDPPTTESARDLLAAWHANSTIHLVFGAREQRFSADALRAALDVRATLADTWRHLRDEGAADDPTLEQLWWGAGAHSRSATAIVHGLHTLMDRGLLELSADGSLRITQPSPAAASTSA